jgi:HD-like signal output (HDOD) protein
VQPDDAYAAGLLQGIGHLILCQCHQRQAIEGFSSVKPLWGRALAEAEVRVFGIAHPLVSAVWVDRLGLPQAVVVAISQSLQGEDKPLAEVRLIRTLQVAADLAAGAALGSSLEETLSGISTELVEQLALGDYFASDAAETDFGDVIDAPELA